MLKDSLQTRQTEIVHAGQKAFEQVTTSFSSGLNGLANLITPRPLEFAYARIDPTSYVESVQRQTEPDQMTQVASVLGWLFGNGDRNANKEGKIRQSFYDRNSGESHEEWVPDPAYERDQSRKRQIEQTRGTSRDKRSQRQPEGCLGSDGYGNALVYEDGRYYFEDPAGQRSVGLSKEALMDLYNNNNGISADGLTEISVQDVLDLDRFNADDL